MIVIDLKAVTRRPHNMYVCIFLNHLKAEHNVNYF
jgi:hypothetical protein